MLAGACAGNRPKGRARAARSASAGHSGPASVACSFTSLIWTSPGSLPPCACLASSRVHRHHPHPTQRAPQSRSLAGAWHRGGTWRCLLKDHLLVQRTGPEMLRAGVDLAQWGPGVSWCGSGTKMGWRQQWQEKGLKSTLRVD